jgi:hypothetical protein
MPSGSAVGSGPPQTRLRWLRLSSHHAPPGPEPFTSLIEFAKPALHNKSPFLYVIADLTTDARDEVIDAGVSVLMFVQQQFTAQVPLSPLQARP